MPPVVKYKRKEAPRKFDKPSSVFAAWRMDDEGLLANCLKHDKMYWKLSKFIKGAELIEVEGVIEEHYEFLKNTHIEMMCDSTFPDTELKEVREFAKRANMFRHNWRPADLDRLFKAVNFE